jgi:hypothetical protein
MAGSPAGWRAGCFSTVSTEEITSLWASALCLTRLENSTEAAAISLARVSSSERARSSINGTTSISANSASRALIPKSCLSLTLLRLKLMRDIFVPDPR